jgi:peptidoglycan hydrolase FlgJ
MATNISGSSGVYGDFAGLEKLKASVRRQDPNALRQVAQQFESLFTRMMLKSMRSAIGKDPIFGNDQTEMYQSMFDDQLSMNLSRGRGLGLADVLMRQLRGGVQSAAQTSASTAVRPASPASAAGKTTAVSPTDAQKSDFVRSLWPQAQQAAQQLGVHPLGVIAQAALESNWGQSVPGGASGASSHNLFGIKAGSSWRGPSVAAPTQEVENGAATSVQGEFRAYRNSSASVQDYVSLLSNNSRYRQALGSGDDVGTFASALQKAGYATDPAYARKVTSVAQQIAALMARPGPASEPVKFADERPITAGTATL